MVSGIGLVVHVRHLEPLSSALWGEEKNLRPHNMLENKQTYIMYLIYPRYHIYIYIYIYISLYKRGSGAGALRNQLGPMADHPPLWVPKIRNEPPMLSFDQNIRT